MAIFDATNSTEERRDKLVGNAGGAPVQLQVVAGCLGYALLDFLLHDFVANSHSQNAEKPVSQQVAVPVHRERL